MVLTDRRNLLGKRPKSACGESSNCRFSFSAARNAITKVTEYVTFGFSFLTLVFFPYKERLKVTVLKRYGFFSDLAAIIRKNSDKRPWIENGEKALPFIHQLDRVARKASDVSAADWRYQTQVKKYRFFFTCVVTAFQTFLEGEKTNKKKEKPKLRIQWLWY